MTGIREVYFAYSNEDAEPYGLSTARIYAEMAKTPSQQSVKVEHVPVQSDGLAPYEAWRQANKR